LSSGTEFRLLGPLEVCSDGVVVQISQGKLRVLLAALLLSANRAVSVDELLEVLWGVDPPPSARVGVQNYVMQLRRALGGAGTRISTQPRGYLIKVEPGELDVARFEALVRQARVAARAGNWPEAASQAAAALDLWRGEPLADIASDLLASRDGPRLAELHAEALATRIDADLRAGLHREVISELKQLIAAQPLRERLHGLLMLALYRDGRQGEALEAYQQARRVLVEELGADPGAELQALHQQILAADPGLAVPPKTSGGTAVVPRELPAPVGQFTGRAAELAALTRLIEQPGDRSSTLVISAIGGTAGVGKTALAVHWAHQVADRFPDGQLYVNLRGYDPGQPMAATDALAGFLTALEGPGKNIPAEIEERASRYRSLLAGKRVLVVLDNAGSVQQVRPLLPGSPGCVVIVTSRDALAGLVARDGAVRVDLDLLPIEDAISLLSTLVGDRVDAAPAAAEMLAARCAWLPLALRVAAELAAARPSASLTDLVIELTSEQERLDVLDAGGDPRTAVRSVFSWSYRQLEAGLARAFRLAGLHPGPAFEAYAVAALTGTTLEQARLDLNALARAHLIQPAEQGRYGMHDLLRAYARECVTEADGADGRQQAQTRLFDHYRDAVVAAAHTLHPAQTRTQASAETSATGLPPLGDQAAARDWLDAERTTLVSVVVYTAAHGWPAHSARLAVAMFRYLDTAGYYNQAVTVHSHGLVAAREIGDEDAEATALNALGLAYLRQGRCGEATGHFLDALTTCRAASRQRGAANALNNLGIAHYIQGLCQQAVEYFQSALTVYRELGDTTGETLARNSIAMVHERQGRYREAIDHYERALELSREHDIGFVDSLLWCNLGIVDVRLGREQQAREKFERALALARDGADRNTEASALAGLGELQARQGRFFAADDYFRQALVLCQEIGDRAGEADTHNHLGEVCLAEGQLETARAHHVAALGIAREVGDGYQQGRAQDGLGRVDHLAGRMDEAREHWQQALDLHLAAGACEAEQVRAQLSDLDAALAADTPAGVASATE
jgi:DNA-binding SARP family transcriptional activator/Flp pilus assembly protein TadD